jgi:predicted aspartyl protease
MAPALGLLLAAAPAATGPSSSLVEQGERHFRAALFEPAERSFREALAFDAQSAEAHHGLAQTLLARRDVSQALSEAEVAVHLSPTDPTPHLTLAYVREHDGDLLGAAAALDDYLRGVHADEHRVRRVRARSHRAMLALAGPGPLRVVDTQKSRTIPFDIVEDKVVLKATINNRIPSDVVLDTGAEHLVLSERTVQRAGLRRAGGGGAKSGPDMTIAGTFDVAGITVRRVPALIRRDPLRVMPTRSGDAFSPIALGLSVIIDYERRELTVARRLPFEPADVELPLHVLGLPVVSGVMGTEAVSFVLDTGSEGTALSATTLARATVAADARRIPMRLFDAWGIRQDDAYLLTPGVNLAFGAVRLNQYPVVIRSWPNVEAVHGFEMGGILGHNFLRRYRVSIDLTRRVVRLKRQLPERP